MTNAEFDQLVDLVVNTGLTPPEILFKAGFNDWYTRISLARFLSHPAYGRTDEAIELLESIICLHPQEPEFLEQKIWSLKRLSLILCRCRNDNPTALYYINQAIDLAEQTSQRFHIITRGDLWGQRWILLHKIKKTTAAIEEANVKIHDFSSGITANNSYLYNAYRFKAQVAGAQANLSGFIRLMKKALSFIRLTTEEKRNLAAALSAKHNNLPRLSAAIDMATPKQIDWLI